MLVPRFIAFSFDFVILTPRLHERCRFERSILAALQGGEDVYSIANSRRFRLCWSKATDIGSIEALSVSKRAKNSDPMKTAPYYF
jgi:hypothetical protein